MHKNNFTDNVNSLPYELQAESKETEKNKDILSLLLPVLYQVTYARAAKLARAGKYFEAETLVTQATKETETPAFFDLLARIYAQQGRLLEAEEMWTKALGTEPSNEHYRAALTLITKMQGRSIWLRPLEAMLVGMMVLSFLVLMALNFTSYLDNFRSSIIDEVRKLVTSARVTEGQTPLQLKMNIRGITTRTEATTVVISFDDGLFAYGVKVKSNSRSILTALGKRLDSHNGQLRIEVIGYTDNIPVNKEQKYTDNVMLGFKRAVAVVELLQGLVRREGTIFSLRSSGEIDSPYPNDTPQNRSRNRTAIIRVSEIQN